VASMGPAIPSNQVPASLQAIYRLFSMVDSDGESAKADLSLINPGPGLAFAVSMLANALDGHVDPPKAVPTLATLLGSRNIAVHRAAAAVLGDIATPDVVAPLATVAFNDSDERVGFLAVRGLALATRAAKPQQPPPSASSPTKSCSSGAPGHAPTSTCREGIAGTSGAICN
jgi:hypothetical protein